MKTLAFEFEIRSIEDAGTFRGLASTYSATPDLTGDVVERGAFTRTLAEKGKQRPLLWAHDLAAPVGTVELTDSALGLECHGSLDLDVQAGKEAYSRMKKRIVRGLSIGFRAARERFVDGIRHLADIDLYEVSLTVLPADERALIWSVKGGIRTVRDFEHFLHESGFSKREAAALASHGFGALETAEPDPDAEVADEFSAWLTTA